MSTVKDRSREGSRARRQSPQGEPDTVRSSDGTVVGFTTVGSGDVGLIIVGGVLRAGQDYAKLGTSLGERFTVHLMDRRGRGASGPQGGAYGIKKEREDLLAVRHATGADAVFGHSYGGVIALQSAREGDVFRRVAVYEPQVPVAAQPPAAWLSRYRDLLASDDSRGAFATMVKHSGFAPGPLAALPLPCLRLVLRLGMRGEEWARTEQLLEANLLEQQAIPATGNMADYQEIDSEVLLLRGGRSPDFVARQLEALAAAIPRSSVRIVDGVGHTAPEAKPETIARQLRPFLNDGVGNGPGRRQRPYQ